MLIIAVEPDWLIHLYQVINCEGNYYENNHYYSTHTINAPYKWDG